jgi:pimeloyl-ACP methyl ester carboxylesterase
MKTVTSSDGTTIAYEQLGSGSPLLLVDGALCSRSFGPMPALAALLKEHFTVVHYDRRGRGDSGDSPTYAVAKEIDDIKALVAAMGGEAFIYGASSGAVLAARAVAGGVRAKKLAMFEPPLALDGKHCPEPKDYIEQIKDHLRAGRRVDAIKLFMKVVGVPGFAVFVMQFMPMFKGLKAIAHTLPYDFAILGDTQRGGPLPDELQNTLRAVTVPTLVAAGGKSPDWFKHSARVVAEQFGGEKHTAIVPGQNHNASAKAIAPMLIELFATESGKTSLRAA